MGWTLIFFALVLAAMPLTFFYIVPLLYSGIHYEKTTKPKIRTITKLISNTKKYKKSKSRIDSLKIADLGSGNGEILAYLAKHLKHKALYTGYEINPFLTSTSKFKIKRKKLSHKVKIKQKNFWRQSLKEFDIIIVFQFGTYMKMLEDKIKKECKKGTIIISNHWELPTLKEIKSENGIHLYKL
jgi:SAM-dependent methyltransferase